MAPTNGVLHDKPYNHTKPLGGGFVFCFYFVCLLIVFKVSSDNPIPHVSTLYCWIWTNNTRIQSCAVHLVCHHATILAIDLHKIIILRVAFLFTESQPIGGVPYCAFGMFFEIINCSFVVLVTKTTRPCMYWDPGNVRQDQWVGLVLSPCTGQFGQSTEWI